LSVGWSVERRVEFPSIVVERCLSLITIFGVRRAVSKWISAGPQSPRRIIGRSAALAERIDDCHGPACRVEDRRRPIRQWINGRHRLPRRIVPERAELAQWMTDSVHLARVVKG